MAHSNFNTLNTEADWQSELDLLVGAAAEAVLADANGTEAEREEAREDLRAFQDYPCPFEYMKRTAQQALDDLTLADIQEALHLLQGLQWKMQGGNSHANAAQFADAAQWPARSPDYSALLAWPEAVAENRALTSQIKTLNSTVKQLLVTDAAGR